MKLKQIRLVTEDVDRLAGYYEALAAASPAQLTSSWDNH